MINLENVINRHEQLKSNRTYIESTLEDCRKFALPNSLPIMGGTYTPAEKDRDNYDSTAELALRNLTSVLMSSITNPSTKWVQLQSDDDGINKEDYLAKEYFEFLERLVQQSIENSNCYINLQEFYKSLGGFGTAVMFIEEGKDTLLNFKNIHISQVYLDEDWQGRVDVLSREIKMNARQIVQQFGIDNVSEAVTKAAENDPTEEFKIVHVVLPRTDREMDSKGNFKEFASNLPYASVWYEEETKHLLEEGGYRVFPFVVCRWSKETGQFYGCSPIMEALADIKTLNRMEKSRLQLAEKINNPPKAVHGDEVDKVDLRPGAINYFEEDTKVQDLVTAGSYPVTHRAIEDKRLAVQNALYVHQLQMIDNKTMTAREVHARQTENLRILGPVFARIQFELLQPFILRVLDIFVAKGIMPVAPKSLANKEYRIRFINPLTRAQNIEELNAINSVLMSAAELSQIKPEVLDNIDFDKAFRMMAEHNGLPMNILIDDRAVQQARMQRAQQAQMQQQMMQEQHQMEQAQGMAKATEKISRSKKNLEGA
jgi:hypothetical protein